MKPILKILLIQIAAATILLQSLKAQTVMEFKKMQPAEKSKLVADSLKKSLHLGGAQFEKVYAILLEGTTNAQPIIKSDCSRMSKGYKLRSLLAEEENKLKAVLTKYQFKLYTKQKEELIAWVKAHKKEKDILMEKI